MIVHAEGYDLVNAIETLLEDAPAGDIKPELMESVLEISTDPCASTAEAGAQLRALRAQVHRDGRRAAGLTIGSAGHPSVRDVGGPADRRPRPLPRPRSRRCASSRARSCIFGMHVHVGVDGPDKAIHVADGMRVHMPVLLALSVNSPFWRADATGLHSTRTPIFRAFPRVGVPPAYGDWEDYADQIDFMTGSGVMEDYTYLWYDVRPHPSFGTVEIRVCDSQTRIEHTLGARGADPGDGQGAVRALRRGRASCPTTRGRCSTRTSGWRRATASTPRSSTCRAPSRVSARDLARRLLDRLRPHAEELGSAAELEGIDDLLRSGTGSERQLQGLRGQPRPARGHEGDRRGDRRGARAGRAAACPLARGGGVASGASMPQAPDLFVVCKSCGSEVSSYVTECPYCGTRLRKRAPKLDADRADRRAPRRPRRAGRRGWASCAPARSPASAPTRRTGRSSTIVLAVALRARHDRAGGLLGVAEVARRRPDRRRVVARRDGAVLRRQPLVRDDLHLRDRAVRLAARAPPRRRSSSLAAVLRGGHGRHRGRGRARDRPARASAPTAPRSGCSAPGSSARCSRRAAARSPRPTSSAPR